MSCNLLINLENVTYNIATIYVVTIKIFKPIT